MSFQEVKGNPKFVAKKKELTGTVDPIFQEQKKRIRASYKRAMLAFVPETYQEKRNDIAEHTNQTLMQEYPETVTYSLINITRVLLPNTPIFETSSAEEGKLDPKVKSALIYTIRVSVNDPRSLERGISTAIETEHNFAVHSYHIGRYSCPIPKFTYNFNNVITDSNIDHFEWRYYIKDSPTEINKLIQKYGEPVQGITVAIANVRGPMYSTEVCAVPNMQEAINEDILSLINANRKGLLGTRPGGIIAYRKWQKLEDELIRSGGATQAQIDKISKEDILKILNEKEGNNNKK